MKLFRRRHTPEELGAILYESLRAAMASETDVSIDRLAGSLDLPTDELSEQYVGEAMIGSMFAASMAIERSTWKWTGQQIEKGMIGEFFLHLREQGATEEQIEEWRAVIDARFSEYRASLLGYEELEPPWKLGRQFYWNMIGDERYVAMSIKIATLYLLEIRDAAQKLMNQYGPTLIVNFAE